MGYDRRTILLVEDDSSDVLLLQMLFSRVGLKPPQIVSAGEAALAYLEGRGVFKDRKMHPMPNVVFLDLKLPGISGFEVLTWIRQHPKLKKLLVVVLTGSILTIDNYRAFELGANGYLVKPPSAEALVELSRTLNLNWINVAEERLG